VSVKIQICPLGVTPTFVLHRYKIFVNGTLIHAVDNGNPLFLKNVRVYLSNPWHQAANALVKNLRVTSSQGGNLF